MGHHISKKVKVDRAKVGVIENFLPPMVKGVRSFLWHASFYKKFLKDFSKIVNPLCKLFKKEGKFHFDESCLKMFRELKEKLLFMPIII